MKHDLAAEIVSEPQTSNSKFAGILDKAMSSRKNPHAVVLGHLGGLKGGPARAQAMSPEARSLQAQNAANARWLKLSPTLEASLPGDEQPPKKRRPARFSSPPRFLIYWHPENAWYVGSALPLVGECCQGRDAVEVARQLDAIVKKRLAANEAKGLRLLVKGKRR